MKREPFFWLTLAVIAFIALMAAGELWEQDIFWQIRAGRELWATGSFPQVDSWSYTSVGRPWFNFQWLATLFIAAAHSWGGIAGLISLRMICATSVLALVVATLARRLSHQEGKWPVIFVTTALIAAALAQRTQIRPDFIMLIPYASLGLVWSREDGSLRGRLLLSLLFLLLAANTHPGSALFAVAFALLAAWQSLGSAGRRLKFLTLSVAAWSCTPYLVHMPSYLLRHIFYKASTWQNNPDHDPLRLSAFLTTEQGLYPWAFAICALLALGILLYRTNQAGGFRHIASSDLFACFLLLALTGMTINRERTIPYAVIAIAPFTAECLLFLWQRRWYRRLVPAGAALLFIAGGLLNQHPLGFRLNTFLYPMACIHFMQQHQPEGRLLHTSRWGDVVLGLLPGYEVAADSREMPFDHLGPLMAQQLFNDPKVMAEFLARYNVNTVMLPLEFFLLIPYKDAPQWSRRITFFPPAAWAVVAYDNQGLLLVSRIAQHAALVERYEYRLAIPDFPPGFYQRSPDRSPQSDERYLGEIDRCLLELSGADYCVLLKARWLRRDRNALGQKAARDLISARLKDEPNNPNLRTEWEMITREDADSSR